MLINKLEAKLDGNEMVCESAEPARILRLLLMEFKAENVDENPQKIVKSFD